MVQSNMMQSLWGVTGFGKKLPKQNFLKSAWGRIGDASDTQGAYNELAKSVSNIYGSGTGIKSAWGGGGLYNTGAGTAFDTISSVASAAGPAGQVVGNVASIASDFSNLVGYNPEVQRIRNTYSNESAPTYDLSSQNKAAGQFMKNYNMDANKSIMGMAAKGGAIGATIGGPLGAGIGAAAGGVLGGIGKVFGAKKARKAEGEMKNELGLAQSSFNRAQESFHNMENSMQRYDERKNYKRSMYGFPQNNSPFMFI